MRRRRGKRRIINAMLLKRENRMRGIRRGKGGRMNEEEERHDEDN